MTVLTKQYLLQTPSNGIVVMKVAYLRSLFPTDNDLPKTRLLVWSRNQRLGMPSYKTVQEGKLFQSVLTLDGKQYTSSMWYVMCRNYVGSIMSTI